MNIIEEQAKDSAFGASSDQFNLVPKGPKAKKVYSKPILIVLYPSHSQSKQVYHTPETQFNQDAGPS